MGRIFGFLAGALSGALVGAVVVILVTPVSGQELREGAEKRWQTAVNEARQASEERRRELEQAFEISTQKP